MAPDHTDPAADAAPADPPVRTLSEAESKRLLGDYGLPVLPEKTVPTAALAAEAADTVGFPAVVKLCGDAIAHKTERNLVRLGLRTRHDVLAAAQELLDAATSRDGDVQVLVAPMVKATREFIVGAERSPEFGPVVMLGVGGIFAEALEDVVFRLLPADDATLEAMIDDLQTQAMLGEFRGEPAVDRNQLVRVLRSVGAALTDRPDIAAIDINPVMIVDGKAVAVDALVAVDVVVPKNPIGATR